LRFWEEKGFCFFFLFSREIHASLDHYREASFALTSLAINFLKKNNVLIVQRTLLGIARDPNRRAKLIRQKNPGCKKTGG